jgi:hypothetical protein
MLVLAGRGSRAVSEGRWSLACICVNLKAVRVCGNKVEVGVALVVTRSSRSSLGCLAQTAALPTHSDAVSSFRNQGGWDWRPGKPSLQHSSAGSQQPAARLDSKSPARIGSRGGVGWWGRGRGGAG